MFAESQQCQRTDGLKPSMSAEELLGKHPEGVGYVGNLSLPAFVGTMDCEHQTVIIEF